MTADTPGSRPPDLKFNITQETKVSWFDTRQLAATAAKTLTAVIVGPMTGRREIMAALSPDNGSTAQYTADANGEFWIDYIADTGDGWNASHSVAWLAGRDSLALSKDGTPTPQPIPASGTVEGRPDVPGALMLEHGKILICGGDQVYPTASAANYNARFSDVFRSARSWQQPARDMFAIPGNHDWYDGLTNFIRLFCQVGDGRRWFGAWRSKQRRSYFNVQLPFGWWLWGIDLALDDDLDPPQLDYFRHQAALLQPDDKVIFCVPSPVWLEKGASKRRIKLDIMLELVTKTRTSSSVPLILSGDQHYYTRHHATVPGGTRDYIVCGGGGAFTLGTIDTPTVITVGNDDAEAVSTAEMTKAFPDVRESKKARRGVFGFPRHNQAFSALLGFGQLVLLWLLSSPLTYVSSEQICGGDYGASWVARNMCSPWSWSGLLSMLGAAGEMAGSPGIILWLAVFVGALTAFAASGRHPARGRLSATVAGVLHALAHCLAGIVVLWLVAHAGYALWDGANVGRLLVVLFTFGLTSGVAGLVFAAYLFLTNKFLHMHDQEVFSSQGIEEFKSFLRMRLDKDGLNIYPVGLLNPERDWVLVKEATQTGQWTSALSKARTFALSVPQDCKRIFDPRRALEPHLIESIHIPNGAPTSGGSRAS